MNNNNEIWIYIGRLCPIHIWHEILINTLLSKTRDRSMLILWSSSAKMSMRNFFSYDERKEFVRAIFWDAINIAWIPDFPTDAEWLNFLDDIIINRFSIEKAEVKDKVVFLWWCEEDVEFFLNDWRRVEIINRFDGSTPKISATEVRDALLFDRNLDWLLNPKIHEMAKKLFKEKWEKFKRM